MSRHEAELRLLAPDLVPLSEPEQADLVDALARLLLRHHQALGTAAGSSDAEELDVSRPDNPLRSS